MKISEAKIEAKVVAYCRERGLYCRKFSSPAHRGVPDRIILGHGKVLFLELKSEGNEPTALQYHELKLIREHGIPARWAASFEMAEILINQVWPEGLI
jgi:hypothetical protein